MIVNGALQRPLEISSVAMQLVPQRWRQLPTGQHYPLQPLPFALPVHGLAGIGNPQRFFNTLRELGVEGRCIPWQTTSHLMNTRFNLCRHDQSL